MARKEKKGTSGFAILLSAAAGAVAGYWLNTTEGKLWRKKTMEQAEELSKDLKKRAGEFTEVVEEEVGYFTDSAKTTFDDLGKQAKRTADQLKKEGERFVQEAKDAMDNTQTESDESLKAAFQEGVDKAKKKMSKLNEDLDPAL